MLKLVALLITLGLWLGVTGLSSPKAVRFSGIPLTLRVSNNTEITNSPPLEIDVVVSGDKRRLAELNKGDLSASLDLTDVSPGEKFIPLTSESVHVTLPPGMKLDEVQPQRIPVTIEPVGEKELPVMAETSGELAEGFELYTAAVLPTKVHVRGPASFLKTLSVLSTEHIDLTGHNEDFVARQVTVPLGNPKATVLENVVDVAIRIGEKRAERALTIPVSGEHSQKRAIVSLYGPRSVLQNIKPANIRLDLIKNDAGDETPQAVLPEEFRDNVEIRTVKLRP